MAQPDPGVAGVAVAQPLPLLVSSAAAATTYGFDPDGFEALARAYGVPGYTVLGQLRYRAADLLALLSGEPA